MRRASAGSKASYNEPSIVQHQVSPWHQGKPRLPATSSDERSPQQCDARTSTCLNPLIGSQDMNRASAVSLVLVISLYPARGPDSRPLIGHQLLGCRSRPQDDRSRRAGGTGQAHPPSGPRTPRLPPGHHSFFFHGLSSFFSVSGVPSQGRCSQQTPSGSAPEMATMDRGRYKPRRINPTMGNTSARRHGPTFNSVCSGAGWVARLWGALRGLAWDVSGGPP